MNRRTFLTGSAVAGIAALAGCVGGGSPPPRESQVVERVKVQNNELKINVESDFVVTSRADVDSRRRTKNDIGVEGTVDALGMLSKLSPVGVAAAAKGRGTGKGGVGRAATGATGRNGRTKWGGGGHTFWYWRHDDDVDEHPARVQEMGLAHLAPAGASGTNLPGPGPVPWDKTWSGDEVSSFEGATLAYDFDRTGWYRVGAHLVHPESNHDFGWEAIDFQLVSGDDGYEVKNQWKVSPPL